MFRNATNNNGAEDADRSRDLLRPVDLTNQSIVSVRYKMHGLELRGNEVYITSRV